MNTPKENPNADLVYQKAILGSVSRTFALTIPLLPPDIEKVVGNAYLLCRIVDTIEDAAELSPSTKQALSKLFLEAVLGKLPGYTSATRTAHQRPVECIAFGTRNF